MMTRFALLLEYDGRPFSGWQRQADRPSVQGALEAAIAAIDGGERLVEAAGRTDSGVHATGQVAHADFQKPWSAFKLKEALNAHLAPQPIAVLAAAAAGPDFHARFAATERAYLYRIIDRRAPLTLEKGRAWRIPVALDTDAMAAAAQSLIGRHDFTTFRDAQCQAKDPVKTLGARAFCPAPSGALDGGRPGGGGPGASPHRRRRAPACRPRSPGLRPGCPARRLVSHTRRIRRFDAV
jgi:tRNA pseudouridine38-40 synthase